MKNKRGRPLGFRLSEESKRAISDAKRGQRHKQITRDKISKTLIIHFKNKNPLSEEIVATYCRIDDDVLCGWVVDVQEALDKIEDVRTERSMRNTRRMELAYGQNIEYFSHDLNPETLLLFKEFCEECGLSMDEAFDRIQGDWDDC